MSTQKRLGRRQALVGLGVAAVGAAAAAPLVHTLLSDASDRELTDAHDPSSREAQAAASPQDLEGPVAQAPALPPATDDVRALFGPLAAGTPISTHWRLEAVHAVRAGAVPVVMSTIYGGRFALEIFQHDAGGPQPVARAGALALFLVNRGDGHSPTGELNGLGVRALGRALEERLAQGAPASIAGLATHRRRMRSEPRGSFDVPLA